MTTDRVGQLGGRTFTVVERRVGFGRREILSTDDWVEAEGAVQTPWPRDVISRGVRGTHPTHDWDDRNPRRCRGCDGWDNGSYGSHAPCGYDWERDSLRAALERERSIRV